MKKLVRDEDVSFSLEVNVEEAYTNMRKVQTVLFRTLSLLRRLGLPTPIDSAISKLMQLISVLNQARLAAIQFQAAAGPIGWALAAVSITTTVVSTTEMLKVDGS